jgi:integrase/recombinase XerC
MRLVRQTYTKLNPKTGKRETRRTKKWYIIYVDHLNKERKVPGYPDKQSSLARGLELEKQAQRIHAGLESAESLAPVKSIRELLADFVESLRASRTSEGHISQRELHVSRTLDGCKIGCPADIVGEKVRLWLAKGMNRAAKPISAQTANHYLASIQHFCEWMREARVIQVNPIEIVRRWDVQTDRRRVRRVLSDEEFEQLIQAVRGSKRCLALEAKPRALLYLVAAYSGYRAGELQSLTVAQVTTGERVCLPIPAKDAKNRKEETIPLPDFVGEELREFVTGKEPGEQIWPGVWADSREAGKMLQRDLARAGIPYLLGGKYYDFHALRCQYATSLLRAGVPLAHAQRLMRHSTPELTMRIYAQLGLEDLAAEVSKLDRPKGEKKGK